MSEHQQAVTGDASTLHGWTEKNAREIAAIIDRVIAREAVETMRRKLRKPEDPPEPREIHQQ